MTSGRDVVIIDTVRSPMGRGAAGGSLSTVQPVALLAQTLRGLWDRVDTDPAEVDEVITGCVERIGERGATIGRTAWLAAGLPAHVPSTTVECGGGSSHQAVHFAAQGVMAGVYDVVVAAGIEAMSRVPSGLNLLGRHHGRPSMSRNCAPGLTSQGVAAELKAQRWDI
ncbi:MAG: steroid 3-ketoacyl-CoA thiolase, partial [Mycobacterium sp.]